MISNPSHTDDSKLYEKTTNFQIKDSINWQDNWSLNVSSSKDQILIPRFSIALGDNLISWVQLMQLEVYSKQNMYAGVLE